MALGELIVAVDDECATAQERAAVLIGLLESRLVRSVPPLSMDDFLPSANEYS